MLKNPLARFPGAGSFVARLLIGVSILILVFTMMAAQPGDRQVLWVFASTLLTPGFLLQAVVIATPRHPRMKSVPKPRTMHGRFMGFSLER